MQSEHDRCKNPVNPACNAGNLTQMDRGWAKQLDGGWRTTAHLHGVNTRTFYCYCEMFIEKKKHSRPVTCKCCKIKLLFFKIYIYIFVPLNLKIEK